MSNRPIHSAADESEHEHVHGPDCRHDHELAMPVTFRREAPKLGRNDPCHCGSGKKFKKCHGVSIDG